MNLGEDENELSLQEKLAVGTGITVFLLAWILWDMRAGVTGGILSALLIEGLIELVVAIVLYVKNAR